MPEATPAGTPATGTPAPAPAPAPAPTPAPQPALPWFASDTTIAEQYGEYVKNKGWSGPSDVIKSYQGAEKLIGRDPNTLLVLPRADDPAGLRAVQSKLGLPESPDKYDFGIPKDKINPVFDGWARKNFHELGLTGSQAKDLIARYEQFGAEAATRQEAEYKASVTADKQTLQREWGGGFERQMNAAQTAVRALGFTAEMVNALESALGYAGTMKYLADMGKKFSEDGFVSGDSQTGFSATMTQAEAKADWEAMKLDTNVMAALRDQMHPGHQAAKQRQTNLFKIMYPETA